MKLTFACYLKWNQKKIKNATYFICINVFNLSFFKEKYLSSICILSRKMHNVVSINVLINVKSLKFLFRWNKIKIEPTI